MASDAKPHPDLVPNVNGDARLTVRFEPLRDACPIDFRKRHGLSPVVKVLQSA